MPEPVVRPATEGTKIFQVTGQNKENIGLSTSWTIRSNPEGQGCRSSIDKIVIAPTLAAANIATNAVALIQEEGIASSSFASTKVTSIQLRADGTQEHTMVNHLLVADFKMEEGNPIPIATEIWFSENPFEDKKAVAAAEKNCREEKPIST